MIRGGSRYSILIAVNLIASAVMLVIFLGSAYTSADQLTSQVLGSQAVTPANYSNEILTQTAYAINELREKEGLPQLSQSEELDQLATKRAADMQKFSYYAHRDSSGKFFSDYMKEQAIPYSYACENLNISASPSSNYFVKSWLESTAGHKECILKGSHRAAGYATATITSLSGIPVNETVVVAIYSDI